MTFYFFVSIIISVIFVALNIILMPFGYLKTCYDKILLAKCSIISYSQVLAFVLFGLLKGILVQFTDLWAFLKSSWDTEEKRSSKTIFTIDRANFNMFYKIVINLDR